MSRGIDAPAVPVRRVLVVDDSLGTQQAVREALAEITGIEVMACGDVESAERILAREKPDLVFCDVVLPGRPGYDLCRQITHAKEDDRPPVYLLSGIFEPFDEERARDAGALDVITKPFRPEEIRKIMEKVMEPAASLEDAGPVAVDDAPLDITAADILSAPQPHLADNSTAGSDRTETDELVRRLLKPLTERLVEPVVAGVLSLLDDDEKPGRNTLDGMLRETVEKVVRQRLQDLEAETEQGNGPGRGTPGTD